MIPIPTSGNMVDVTAPPKKKQVIPESTIDTMVGLTATTTAAAATAAIITTTSPRLTMFCS